MGTLTEKRPDATSGSGKRMKMSARDAVGLIRRAKRRGAKVDVKPALAKPTGPVQKKAGCSLCAMAGGSGPETAPAGYSCPLCSGKGGAAGPALEAPQDSVQHKGAGTADAAEAQADVLGAQIGAELGGAGSVSSGPIPSGVRSVAERHLGVGLGGTELRADAGAHARTASVGALAMTEGSTVSFGAGQLSTSTAAGRSLIGHELTHVAQQRAHGTAARQGFLGFGDDDGETQSAAGAPEPAAVFPLPGDDAQAAEGRTAAPTPNASIGGSLATDVLGVEAHASVTVTIGPDGLTIEGEAGVAFPGEGVRRGLDGLDLPSPTTPPAPGATAVPRILSVDFASDVSDLRDRRDSWDSGGPLFPRPHLVPGRESSPTVQMLGATVFARVVIDAPESSPVTVSGVETLGRPYLSFSERVGTVAGETSVLTSALAPLPAMVDVNHANFSWTVEQGGVRTTQEFPQVRIYASAAAAPSGTTIRQLERAIQESFGTDGTLKQVLDRLKRQFPNYGSVFCPSRACASLWQAPNANGGPDCTTIVRYWELILDTLGIPPKNVDVQRDQVWIYAEPQSPNVVREDGPGTAVPGLKRQKGFSLLDSGGGLNAFESCLRLTGDIAAEHLEQYQCGGMQMSRCRSRPQDDGFASPEMVFFTAFVAMLDPALHSVASYRDVFGCR